MLPVFPVPAVFISPPKRTTAIVVGVPLTTACIVIAPFPEDPPTSPVAVMTGNEVVNVYDENCGKISASSSVPVPVGNRTDRVDNKDAFPPVVM
jgi:hypothetical protein